MYYICSEVVLWQLAIIDIDFQAVWNSVIVVPIYTEILLLA